MSGLFSHSSAAGDLPAPRPPLEAVVTVPAPADHAWAGLTEHLHLWWPADELSRWGDDSFFDLEDNALVETSAEDEENVWGEVIEGRPGQWLELRWKHPGSASTTQVRLELVLGDGGAADTAEPTLVNRPGESTSTVLTLGHDGWTTADPQDTYDFYRLFWPGALARYRRFMGGS